MLAGQETGSNTLSFALYELARHPHYQNRLRAEIRAMERVVHERGSATFTSFDLDGMPFLQALAREVLRYHPVVPHNYRQALKDDVLPLSKPIKTMSGRLVDEIPIPKGTRVVLSVAAYNRYVLMVTLENAAKDTIDGCGIGIKMFGVRTRTSSTQNVS